jgi:glycine/D-amino acid oxidase-like deaminating enzyme
MTAVQHRDLRGGQSPWEKDLSRTDYPPLSSDLRCDVAVIGGGVSGALLAEALSSRNLQVVVLDRRGIARGATAASTAMVEFELDNPLIQLSKDIGRERAERIYRRSLRVVSDLLAKIERLGIECEQSPRETLYLCGDKLDAHEMTEEVEARRAISIPSQYLLRPEIFDQFGIERDAAILSSGSMQLNPVCLTEGLIRCAVSNGAKVFEHEEFTGFDTGKRTVTVRTKSGYAIEAQHLVFATGYEIPDCVPRDGYKVVSTWAIMTGPQGKLWPREVMITEASEPYLYVRSEGKRVIAGGEDEQAGDSATRANCFAEKTAAIQQKLKTMLPYLDVKAEFAWTGAFGITGDGLPLSGKIPGYPRCHALMGFGGNGTTFSELGAQIIAGDILGEPDPDADLFSFGDAPGMPP